MCHRLTWQTYFFRNIVMTDLHFIISSGKCWWFRTLDFTQVTYAHVTALFLSITWHMFLSIHRHVSVKACYKTIRCIDMLEQIQKHGKDIFVYIEAGNNSQEMTRLPKKIQNSKNKCTWHSVWFPYLIRWVIKYLCMCQACAVVSLG